MTRVLSFTCWDEKKQLQVYMVNCGDLCNVRFGQNVVDAAESYSTIADDFQ